MISIAPMMEWTDRYYRRFMRLITQKTMLYSEMIHANAVVKGDHNKLLYINDIEKPVTLQLGGHEPNILGIAAKIAKSYNYDGINLNVGCPSQRVQTGKFGACLMDEPYLVVDCLNAMGEAVDWSIPITIKHRTGLGEKYDYDKLEKFVTIIKHNTACREFIIHARNAILNLSTKDNRQIPPLEYNYVYRIKERFNDLKITLNGGISIDNRIDAQKYHETPDNNLILSLQHLEHVDGIMLGRSAYHDPYSMIIADGIIDEFKYYDINKFTHKGHSVHYEYNNYTKNNNHDIDKHKLIQKLNNITNQTKTRLAIVKQLKIYIANLLKYNIHDKAIEQVLDSQSLELSLYEVKTLIRHIHGLYYYTDYATMWKRKLEELKLTLNKISIDQGSIMQHFFNQYDCLINTLSDEL